VGEVLRFMEDGKKSKRAHRRLSPISGSAWIGTGAIVDRTTFAELVGNGKNRSAATSPTDI